MEDIMKRRCIVLVELALALVIVLNASSVYSLTIKQPGNNSVYYLGQKIKVVVEAASNEDITAIWLYLTPEGSSGVILNPPYELELKLNNEYVGSARIEAVAR